MPSVAKNDDLNAKDIEDENTGSNVQRTKLYDLLSQREQAWWQARQQRIPVGGVAG